MGTKQHKTYCAACGKTTNHVTVYQKADDGGRLIATVQCFEHSDGRCVPASTSTQTVGSGISERLRTNHAATVLRIPLTCPREEMPSPVRAS
jgi:hypothetical protein